MMTGGLMRLVRKNGRNALEWVGSSFARKLGLSLIVIITALAALAPWVAPFDPDQTGIPYLPMSWTHLLGTNDMGKDIFSQLLFAGRNSLLIGLTSAAIAVVIGVSVGIAAGFQRGVLEDLLMGSTDIFLLIPGLPLMIILASYLDPSIWNIVLVIGLLWWCPVARVVHARTLQLRESEFVDSARLLGYSNVYIMRKHILPNVRDVITARFGMAVATGMLAEASLSFLGLGDPFNISWGGMISEAFNRGGFTNDMLWWYVPPGIMLLLSIVGFVLLGLSLDRNDSRVEAL